MKEIPSTLSMILCMFLITTWQTGCSTPKVISRWPAEPIEVNGSDDDWRGIHQYHDAEKQVTVRIADDGDALYICFSANDGDLKKKLMMTGLTLWIDPRGGKDRKYGIRLSMKPPRPNGNNYKRDRNHLKKGDGPALKKPEKLEIIHPDATDPLVMKIEDAAESGAKVGVGRSGGRLVYEYKIMTKGDDFLFAFDSGKILGIGIEAGKMGAEKTKRKGRPNGGMGGPGGGGSMSRRGDGMGGGRSGGMKGPGGSGRAGLRKMGEPFEVWLKVESVSQTNGGS